MKTIFLMYLLIIPVCLQAQIEQYTRVLEPSVLVCQYECVKKVDTLGTDKNCETMILRIGKKISQFYAYLSFYCDSMFNDPTGRRLWGQMMVQAIRSRNYASMPTSKITSNYYYKNYPEGKITTLALLGTTECLMEEEYISQDWKLADSTKIIRVITIK